MRPRVTLLVISAVLTLTAVILVLFLRGVVTGGGNATPQRGPTVPTAVGQATQAPLAAPSAIEGLTLSPQQTRYAFDSVNGASVPTASGQDAVIRVPRGTPIQVIGWAVDSAQMTAAGGVFLSIDNALTTPTTYGFDRSDVAQTLGNPAYAKTGFSGNVPTDQLAPGRHLLIMKIVSGDRRSYYQPPQAITIEIV